MPFWSQENWEFKLYLMPNNKIIEEKIEVPRFSVDEVGDILKSKKNLTYLLELNGKLNRISTSTWTDGDAELLEDGTEGREEAAKTVGDYHDPQDPARQGGGCGQHLDGHKGNRQYQRLFPGDLRSWRPTTKSDLHVHGEN